MAEMTATAMVEWLTADKAFGQECYSRKQIAALIQQQAQTIEAQAKRLEAAEKVCKATRDCLPTIHVMEEWKKVKEINDV